MFKIKKFTAIFFVFFLIFSTHNAYATGLDLPNTRINPNSYLFYSFKRLFEKAIFFTKFSNDSKVDYYQELFKIRMAELKFVVENNLIGEVQKSSERLSYQTGVLSDYVAVESKLTSKKQDISDLLKSYKNLLAELRDKFPANSSYWMLVQHSLNSIDLNLEKLK